jgi:hypothetical protein
MQPRNLDRRQNLRTPVDKTPDADLLREMVGFAAQRLMELEGGQTKAAYGELGGSMARRILNGLAKGYHDRIWETGRGRAAHHQAA